MKTYLLHYNIVSQVQLLLHNYVQHCFLRHLSFNIETKKLNTKILTSITNNPGEVILQQKKNKLVTVTSF